MTKPQHLFRRGNVYYWRRKLVGFSTKKCTAVDFQLSLGTTDRTIATKLAAILTWKSTTMLDHDLLPEISPAEARAYLKDLIATERKKLARVRTVVRMDACEHGGDIDDGQDWAFAQAWKLIHRRGVNATFLSEDLARFQTDGISDAWIGYLDLALTSVKERATAPARDKARRDAFEAVNGRTPGSALETMQLRELFISALTAIQDDPDPGDTDNLVAAVLKEVKLGDHAAGPVPNDSQETTFVPVPSTHDRRSTDTVEEPRVDPHDEENPQLDPSIMAVLERMIAIKQSDGTGLEEKTAQHYRSFGKLLIRIIGKEDVRQLRQTDATNFRAQLTRLPKSFGKSPSHHILPISEIIERAKSLPAEKVGLSTATINRYLEQLGTLVAWADSEGIRVDRNLKPNKLRRPENMRARDKARTAKLGELVAVFSHPFWIAPMMDRPKGSTLVLRRKSGLYWLPLIVAYTGARREEACGLTPDDCLQDPDGTWFFRIAESNVRRVKTMASNRIVPIHSDLIKLGLLDVIEEARKRYPDDILFPDIREPKGKVLGRKVGRHIANIVEETYGPTGKGLNLKSMRHHFQHCLDLDKEVPEKVCRDLVGHEGNDVHTRHYGDQTPMSELKFAVERLPRMVPDEIFSL
ncbi:hypothetical protein [Roseicyclus amphidinii]|uniref:hypothetical protein n=1 Tax=Roseicyclus amphidinii TaxID=3034232 RepID=UPI0024E094EF|nr:hypothetical protein [Roseicyclus sp. Amp-Y-6]